jgi:hypothetical protein
MCQYPPPPPPPDAFVPWFSQVFDAVLLLTAVVVGEQAARLTAQANVRISECLSQSCTIRRSCSASLKVADGIPLLSIKGAAGSFAGTLPPAQDLPHRGCRGASREA